MLCRRSDAKTRSADAGSLIQLGDTILQLESYPNDGEEKENPKKLIPVCSMYLDKTKLS